MVRCCKVLSSLFQPCSCLAPSLPHKAAAKQQSWGSGGPVQGLLQFLAKQLHAQVRAFKSRSVLAGDWQGVLQAGTRSKPCPITHPGKGDSQESRHSVAPVPAQLEHSAVGVPRATEALVPLAGGCCVTAGSPAGKGREGR